MDYSRNFFKIAGTITTENNKMCVNRMWKKLILFLYLLRLKKQELKWECETLKYKT